MDTIIIDGVTYNLVPVEGLKTETFHIAENSMPWNDVLRERLEVTENQTLTGFVMNTNAVKRGGVYEAVNKIGLRSTTAADREASEDAVKILRKIVAERKTETRVAEFDCYVHDAAGGTEGKISSHDLADFIGKRVRVTVLEVQE